LTCAAWYSPAREAVVATKKTTKRIYKVIFMGQGKLYEIYARNVSHGSLLGFVEVEELLFGEKTKVVVDPSEESLKNEFAGVRRTYVPMHAVVRIDQVEKEGSARVVDGGKEGGKLSPFPVPVFPPGGDSSKT
jgi:hypothetical protein